MPDATIVRQTPSELHALVEVPLPPTSWFTIDQPRIDLFAEATNDHQWIHVDPLRARSGPYETTIAHGYLVLSLIGPMFAGVLQVSGASMVVNYGLDRVRFISPLPVDSRIRLSASVVAAEDVAGGVQVIVRNTVEAESTSKPVCVADAIFRYCD